MRVLMISGDKNILNAQSAVARRLVLYGGACDELHIVVPGVGERVQIADNVFVHPTGTESPLKRINAAVEIGKTIATDLVTAQDPFEYGIAALRLGGILKVPVELQVHTDIGSSYFAKGFSAQEIRNKMRMSGVSMRLRRAAGVRVVSARVARAAEHLGVVKTRLSVLPMYIDTARFLDVARIPSQREKIIFMAGRLEREKEYPIALTAFARVHAHVPEARLHIAGEGKLHTQLRIYAQRLGIEDAVTFLGAVADVVPHLTEAHVFLHTAQYEGFGAAIAEAALAGVPVVSTDVGIAGTLLQDGEHAWIVPVGDTDRMTGALLEAITRPKESHERALQASAWMHKHLLAPDAYVAALQSVWEKTVKNK